MDPLEHLTYPSDADIIPDLAQGIIGGMGMILSPTTLVREALSKTMDFDPLEGVLKFLWGDWNSVAQMSRAYNNVADYVDECAAELRTEVTTALAQWSGDAATSAKDYALEQLAPALNKLAFNIRSVSGQCQSVAIGMQQTAALFNDLINYFMDLLVLWLAEAAATAALSWTGIVAIAGGVALALTTLKMVSVAKKAGKTLTLAQALLDAMSGLVPGYLGAIDGFKSVPIPKM